MASSSGGFRNTSKRAQRHAAFVKKANRKRNLQGVTNKRGSTNG
jgi:hypothetical protein